MLNHNWPLAQSVAESREMMRAGVKSMAVITELNAPVEEFKEAMLKSGPTLWLPAKHSLQTELMGDEGRNHRAETLSSILDFITAGGFRVLGFHDTNFHSLIGRGTSSIAPELGDHVTRQSMLGAATRHLGVLAMGPMRPAAERIEGSGERGKSIFSLFEVWRVLTSEGELKTTLAAQRKS